MNFNKVSVQIRHIIDLILLSLKIGSSPDSRHVTIMPWKWEKDFTVANGDILTRILVIFFFISPDGKK